MVLPGGRGSRCGGVVMGSSYLADRHGVSVGLDERVLEMGTQQYPIGYATIRSC